MHETSRNRRFEERLWSANGHFPVLIRSRGRREVRLQGVVDLRSSQFAKPRSKNAAVLDGQKNVLDALRAVR